MAPRDGCVCFELLQGLLTFHIHLTLDSDAVPETAPILSDMSFLISASNKTLSSQSVKFDAIETGPIWWPFAHSPSLPPLDFCL